MGGPKTARVPTAHRDHEKLRDTAASISAPSPVRRPHLHQAPTQARMACRVALVLAAIGTGWVVFGCSRAPWTLGEPQLGFSPFGDSLIGIGFVNNDVGCAPLRPMVELKNVGPEPRSQCNNVSVVALPGAVGRVSNASAFAVEEVRAGPQPPFIVQPIARHGPTTRSLLFCGSDMTHLRVLVKACRGCSLTVSLNGVVFWGGAVPAAPFRVDFPNRLVWILDPVPSGGGQGAALALFHGPDGHNVALFPHLVYVVRV